MSGALPSPSPLTRSGRNPPYALEEARYPVARGLPRQVVPESIGAAGNEAPRNRHAGEMRDAQRPAVRLAPEAAGLMLRVGLGSPDGSLQPESGVACRPRGPRDLGRRKPSQAPCPEQGAGAGPLAGSGNRHMFDTVTRHPAA